MTTAQLAGPGESMTAAASPLTFDRGLAGFPGVRTFALAPVDEGGVFELTSTDDPSLGFVVLAPGPYFPDYHPVIDDETAAELALTSADDAEVLLIVTLGARAEDATANLLAPLVVNRHTRRAAQVVLADQPFPLRAPIVGR